MTVKDLAVGQVQQVRCEFANTGRRLGDRTPRDAYLNGP
jgi:hypothetical protein